MTIYTIMGNNDHTEWVAKSFTCERTAIEFLHFCRSCAYRASSVTELRNYSPDPGLVKPHVLHGLRDNRIYYSIESNELVTDAFMELTLQPPNSKILSETVTAIVSDWNTIEPRFKLFGGTSGSLKYFTKVKPGTKLQITIKEFL